MSETEQEKRNKRNALLSTAGVTVAVLLLMLFVMAWQAPDPPLPEYGIELNFGTDTRGSGDVQPNEPVGAEEAKEESQEPPVEEQQPEPTETTQQEEATPAETTPQQQAATPVESPVSVKEKKEEQPKPVEKPVEKPAEKKPEPVKQQKPDPNTQYDPSKRPGKQGREGDDKNAPGDKGDPSGQLGPAEYTGKAGGGDGESSLSLDGWNWDAIPRPTIPKNETGRIVFEISVDENGELIRIRLRERGVSPEAERICREAIDRLTFTKKPGANVPSVSTGTITFVYTAE